MGFCLFNNVALAVQHARRARPDARRVIVDWDVHHGNGTQAQFADDPGLFYASTHQSPLYPGTGARSETGVGNIVNVPLPPVRRLAPVPPRLQRRDPAGPRRISGPEMLLISAGFDAHRRDPLGAAAARREPTIRLGDRALLDIARQHADGRIVSTLEGGYDLAALAASAAAHVRVLMSV